MLENLEEDELAAAFLNGENEALTELINRLKAGLFGFLLSMTGRSDIAEDLFQEVFLKFVNRPQLYKPRQKFRAWIFAIARNAALDYFRKEKRHAAISLSGIDADGNFTDSGEKLLSRNQNISSRPDEYYENICRGQRIKAALACLSREQSEVFYLRHYSGLSFKEIALLLDIPLGTALARMSRALATLRRVLGDLDGA